jgi:hypothetical protein
VLFIHKINRLSVFVVELATREDSHKNNEKQPVTLCGVLTLFRLPLHSTLSKSLYGLLCALALTETNSTHYRGITVVIRIVGVGIGLRLDELEPSANSEALATDLLKPCMGER